MSASTAQLPERQVTERMETLEINADRFSQRDSLTIDEERELRELLQPAVAFLQAGEAIGLPTETVYGLAANALSDSAVSKIFAAKGRPSDNPLIAHVSSMQMMVEQLVDRAAYENPALQRQWAHVSALAERFWPGPLTILVPKSEKVSRLCTAGVPTVAVRMPSHPIARRLIDYAGLPLAAPSANISGRPSPTSAAHVSADLGGSIACIVSGGLCSHGLESTVVDVWHSPPLVLRPGAVTLEQLRELIPDVQHFAPAAADVEKPATPGLKYRHYSPDTPVSLLCPSAAGDAGSAIAALLLGELERLPSAADRLALVHTRPGTVYPDALLKHPQLVFRSLVGEQSDEEAALHSVAAGMFAALRDLERTAGVQSIYFVAVTDQGTGAAIMNRIRKAASSCINLTV